MYLSVSEAAVSFTPCSYIRLLWCRLLFTERQSQPCAGSCNTNKEHAAALVSNWHIKLQKQDIWDIKADTSHHLVLWLYNLRGPRSWVEWWEREQVNEVRSSVVWWGMLEWRRSSWTRGSNVVCWSRHEDKGRQGTWDSGEQVLEKQWKPSQGTLQQRDWIIWWILWEVSSGT